MLIIVMERWWKKCAKKWKMKHRNSLPYQQNMNKAVEVVTKKMVAFYRDYNNVL
jgi:hypothetical protein